jgi:site-specific DNA recombinase
MNETVRRVATYERVSSEDQRERDTILTQTEELARKLGTDADVQLVERYADNGVSGMKPMIQREAGGRMLRDAEARRFEELWVYKLNRLGRDAVDLLWVRRRLDQLGIRLISVVEGEQDLLGYDVHAVVSDYDRRAFLRHSMDGMNRAARAGRYCGGIVPIGYRVEGIRPNAHLVPDDTHMWGGLTAAQIVVRIFHLVAIDAYSARKVTDEFNQLGIPTAYKRDGRGIRGKRTQGIWRPGRILQIVKNTTYYGEYRYGKRSSKRDREIIPARVPPLISKELWNATQEALGLHRRTPPDRRRPYLLRSLIKCEICGLNYTGSMSHGDVWYRCNGQLVGRGPLEGRCPAKGVKGEQLEPVIKRDIEGFFRNPGDLLKELAEQVEREHDSATAVAEAERTTLAEALQKVNAQRDRLLDLYLDSQFARDELDHRLAKLEADRVAIQQRLDALEDAAEPEPEPITPDLLAELQRRLDDGLDDKQWHEIVSLLVRKIGIHTTQLENGRKQARAVVEYRFNSVVETVTGRDSWRPPA